MAYIYSVTNTINNKQYIGKCTQSIDKRWREHLSDAKKERCIKRPLYDAINKYGADSFWIQELEECSELVASEREIYWIDKLGTYGKGYNATLGGEGTLVFDYKEIVDAYKTGLTVKETAAKIGCCVDTASTALVSYGIDTSKNRHKNISKQVEQYSLDGKHIQTYNSLTEASKAVNVHRTSIGRAANGKAKTSAGYMWRYKEI